MPWKRQSDLTLGRGIEVTETDRSSFITGQRLEGHGMRVMSGQDGDVFPKCMVVNRMWMEEKLYPQYGDLKSTMFGQSRGPRRGFLQRRREELRMKGNFGWEGIKDPGIGNQVGVAGDGEVNATMAEALEKQLKIKEEQRKAAREAKKERKKQTEGWMHGLGRNWL